MNRAFACRTVRLLEQCCRQDRGAKEASLVRLPKPPAGGDEKYGSP